MSNSSAQPSSDLTSRYTSQLTSDLATVNTEIAALEERLEILRKDQELLAGMQQALSGSDTELPTAPAAAIPAQTKPEETAPAEPATASKADSKSEPKAESKAKSAPKSRAQSTRSAAKSAGSANSTKAPKQAKASRTAKAVKSSKPAKAAAKDSGPTLVDLVRSCLTEQSEPRSATEITQSLTQAHPDRTIKTTVVRSTVEALVAKGHAERSKQGTSVFYTAASPAAEPAPVAASAAPESA
ncbi:hypothetical protein [Streptomyces sp. KL116D]|uniref:hypothetical protein n=1 Tax=Streptomyces sp. KL116D TaxID=3045152 RepID=UPI00355611A1